jgi:hypothetical protein
MLRFFTQSMNGVTFKDVRVGSIVMVRPDFGNKAEIRVTVRNVEADIKNGRPGIDYDVKY